MSAPIVHVILLPSASDFPALHTAVLWLYLVCSGPRCFQPSGVTVPLVQRYSADCARASAEYRESFLACLPLLTFP